MKLGVIIVLIILALLLLFILSLYIIYNKILIVYQNNIGNLILIYTFMLARRFRNKQNFHIKPIYIKKPCKLLNELPKYIPYDKDNLEHINITKQLLNLPVSNLYLRDPCSEWQYPSKLLQIMQPMMYKILRNSLSSLGFNPVGGIDNKGDGSNKSNSVNKNKSNNTDDKSNIIDKSNGIKSNTDNKSNSVDKSNDIKSNIVDKSNGIKSNNTDNKSNGIDKNISNNTDDKSDSMNKNISSNVRDIINDKTYTYDIVVHFRCSDVPFNRNPDYTFLFYDYYGTIINNLHCIKVDNKKYKLMLMFCPNHRNKNQDQLQACKEYAINLRNYLSSLECVDNVQMCCQSIEHDFATMIYCPILISSGSSMASVASIARSGLSILPSPNKSNKLEMRGKIYPNLNVVYVDVTKARLYHSKVKDYLDYKSVCEKLYKKLSGDVKADIINTMISANDN